VIEQLPCIISGVSFTVNITNGIRSSRKAVLSIDALECEDVSNEENISIPFRFDLGFSKVVVGGISSQPTRAEQDATEVHVQPVFTGYVKVLRIVAILEFGTVYSHYVVVFFAYMST
jgi:hypothetical protein